MANNKIQGIYDSFTVEKDLAKVLTEETQKKLTEVKNSLDYEKRGEQLKTDSEAFLTNLQNIFKEFYNNIKAKRKSYFQDRRAYMVWDYISRRLENTEYEEVEATQEQKANLQEIAEGIKNKNDAAARKEARATAKKIKNEKSRSIPEKVGGNIFSILSQQYTRRTELYGKMYKALQQKGTIDVLALVKQHGAAIGATSRSHEKGKQDLLDKNTFFKHCLQYQGKLNNAMNQKQVTVFVTLDTKKRVIQIFQIQELEIPKYVSIGASSDEKQLIFKYSIGQIKKAAAKKNNLISISQRLISIPNKTTISEEIVDALTKRSISEEIVGGLTKSQVVDSHLEKTVNAYLSGEYKMTSKGIGAQAFIAYLLKQHVGLGTLIHEVDNVSGLLQGDIDLGKTQLAIKSTNASSLSIPQLIETAKVIIEIKPSENIIPFLFFLKDALNASSTLINKEEYKEGNEEVDKKIFEEINQEITNLLKLNKT